MLSDACHYEPVCFGEEFSVKVIFFQQGADQIGLDSESSAAADLRGPSKAADDGEIGGGEQAFS